MLNKILRNPTFTHTADIQQICAPLSLLGITYFSHGQIDEQGRFAGIGSHPEFVKLYYEKKYYHYDIHMAEFSANYSHILWDNMPLSKETQAMDDYFLDYGFAHTFTIIRQQEKIKNYYHFATKPNEMATNQRYWKYYDLLNQFINYYTDQFNKNRWLHKGFDIKFKLNEQDSSCFINDDLIENKILSFRQAIKSNKIYLDAQRYLTQREWECLYWLAAGKNMEEIAIICNITLRTVKAHVINIKNKFNCQNQFQLGMMFYQLNS